jgi:sortase A
MVVVNGTSTADLRKGPGHYLETAYPWESSGRVAIAGHRTTYLHPFWSLDKLRPGDVIRLVTEYGTFIYHVTGSRVILPSGIWVLNQTKAPTLVLTTCTPRFSATHRLVVFASR